MASKGMNGDTSGFAVKIVVLDSLRAEIEMGDEKTKKLFYKQKRFMELRPDYPSLGRTKLKEVVDKYGNALWEVRLDGKRRIVFVDREGIAVWLKICGHDEIRRGGTISVNDEY